MNMHHHAALKLLFCRLLFKKLKIYRTTILHRVLYGQVTCFAMSRVEHDLRMSENRALRRIFGPEKEKVTGRLKKPKSNEDQMNECKLGWLMLRLEEIEMHSKLCLKNMNVLADLGVEEGKSEVVLHSLNHLVCNSFLVSDFCPHSGNLLYQNPFIFQNCVK
jgi:hypothetical protein